MAEDPITIARRKAQELAKLAQSNGNEDPGRKRSLDDIGSEGPDSKKAAVDPSIPTSIQNAQAIAKAAVSKLSAEFGFQQTMSIEIKVPNRMVGLVIGRGGEMITKLQAEAGAKIQVAPDGTEINGERQVNISGSPECVEKAKSLVNEVIENAGGATNLPPMNLQPGQEVVELMIPASKVGLIIGKGGEMIKMLQERAGCKMQMIQDGPYSSAPEKPLRMTGFAENCKKARQLVLELLETKELERGSGGAISGGGGGAGAVPMNNMGMGGKQRIDLPNPSGPGVTTTQVPVPSNKCGLIIGKGGDTIRQLMVQSGAYIALDTKSPDPNEKLFNVKGTTQQIQVAQQLITAKIEGNSYPGQGNPYGMYQGVGGGGYQQPMGGSANSWQGQYAYGQQGTYQQQGGGYTANPQQDQAQAWSAYYQWAAQQQPQLLQQQQQQGGAAAGGQPQQGQQQQQQPSGGAPQFPGQQGQPRPQTQPTPGGSSAAPGAQSADYQAQWAEYYKQLGYYYNQQQQQPGGGGTTAGQQPTPASTGGPPEQKHGA